MFNKLTSFNKTYSKKREIEQRKDRKHDCLAVYLGM